MAEKKGNTSKPNNTNSQSKGKQDKQSSKPKKEVDTKAKEVSKKEEVVLSESENSIKGKQVTIAKPKLYKALAIVGVILVTIIAVDLLVQYMNNSSTAIVNGERISKSEYKERLEEAYGSVISSQLITEELILQEAAKKNIEVTAEEIDKVVSKTIEDLGGEEAYLSALEQNGLTEESYRRNITIQRTAEKLVVKDPTEEELKAFFEENKSVYFPDEEVNYEDVKEQLSEYYVTAKFNELSQQWLSELRGNATIQDNIAEPKSYAFLAIFREYLDNMNSRLEDENVDTETTDETTPEGNVEPIVDEPTDVPTEVEVTE